MFTVEFESEDTIITTLDDTGNHEDVELLIGSEGEVWIRQFDEELNGYDLISMSRNQFLDILSAWNSGEGSYYRQQKRKANG
jgi:hypothetical protein